MSSSKYKIGLFGFGCVGQGLYQTLAENEKIDAEIVKICVKHHGVKRPFPEEKFIYDPKAILEGEQINLVVELIDDAKVALDIVTEALKRGKAVVTANKKMVAENLDLLIQLQKEYNTPLLYEGAVCGSIPIIRTLEDYYAMEHIEEIKGIFNGSTNYILTKVFQEGKGYDEALKEAQDSGFAETDPTLDVGGFDPKFKLSILLQHAFGVSIPPADIFNWGIQHISDADIAFAKERGLKIKLLAKAVRTAEGITARVAPQFVDNQSPLYHVENEYNCVLVKGEFAGDQVLIGKGAGSLPTGLAVLSDVVAITNNRSYGYPKHGASVPQAEKEAEVYLSFENVEAVDLSLFSSISEKYTGKENGYVIGKISRKNLLVLGEQSQKGGVSLIFTCGAHKEVQLPNLTYSYGTA